MLDSGQRSDSSPSHLDSGSGAAPAIVLMHGGMAGMTRTITNHQPANRQLPIASNASLEQQSRQVRHSVQFSESTSTTNEGDTSNASSGHSNTQEPQPIHFAAFTIMAITVLLLLRRLRRGWVHIIGKYFLRQ